MVRKTAHHFVCILIEIRAETARPAVNQGTLSNIALIDHYLIIDYAILNQTQRLAKVGGLDVWCTLDMGSRNIAGPCSSALEIKGPLTLLYSNAPGLIKLHTHTYINITYL